MKLWDKIKLRAKDIDSWRKLHLAFAEWVDAWRIIPRFILVFYGYFLWDMYKWYKTLEPSMIKGCDVNILKDACIAHAPTTDHMAIITAMIAASAAVVGLYTNSGKKWDKGFIHWNKPDTVIDDTKTKSKIDDNKNTE